MAGKKNERTVSGGMAEGSGNIHGARLFSSLPFFKLPFFLFFFCVFLQNAVLHFLHLGLSLVLRCDDRYMAQRDFHPASSRVSRASRACSLRIQVQHHRGVPQRRQGARPACGVHSDGQGLEASNRITGEITK